MKKGCVLKRLLKFPRRAFAARQASVNTKAAGAAKRLTDLMFPNIFSISFMSVPYRMRVRIRFSVFMIPNPTAYAKGSDPAARGVGTCDCRVKLL